MPRKLSPAAAREAALLRRLKRLCRSGVAWPPSPALTMEEAYFLARKVQQDTERRLRRESRDAP